MLCPPNRSQSTTIDPKRSVSHTRNCQKKYDVTNILELNRILNEGVIKDVLRYKKFGLNGSSLAFQTMTPNAKKIESLKHQIKQSMKIKSPRYKSVQRVRKKVHFTDRNRELD